MKPQDIQLKRESASQKVSGMTIKRSYGSMPNLTPVALIIGGDTTAILQAPTAVTIQLVSTEPIAFCPTPIKLTNYARPQMRYHIALVMRLRLAATFVCGVHWFLFRRGPILYLDLAKGPLCLPINTPLITIPSAAAEVENASPSVSSDRQVTAAEPNRDGSGKSDVKSQDLGDRPKRLWYSMPNMALHYTDNVFYDTEIKCTDPMKVSRGSSTRSSMTVTEAVVTQVKLKS